MKIVAFSDSHAASYPASWKAFFDKRALGLFNHHYFRKHRHNQNYLSKMVNKILEISPDLVICTGDLTTSGEPSEFELSCNLIKPLVDSTDFEMIYVPGNHDYYVHDEICYASLKKTFSYLNRGRGKFEDLPASLSVKGLSFCLTNACKPMHLLLSSGVMSAKTVDYVLNWAESESNEPKILIGHYPLIEEHPIMRFRHRLWGHEKVLQAFQNKKIDLSICGHVHNPCARLDDTGRGEVIVGSITRNACFALIEYDEKTNFFAYNKIDVEV